jgi:hypothetical protein
LTLNAIVLVSVFCWGGTSLVSSVSTSYGVVWRGRVVSSVSIGFGAEVW